MNLILIILLFLLSGAVLAEPEENTRQCNSLLDIDNTTLFYFKKLREKYLLTPYVGKNIAKIIIKSLPIFDTSNPKEDYWLYGLVNRLHSDTYESVIRQQLLLKSGSLINIREVAESERILRNSSSLIDAVIIPFAECNDGIDLLVLTRDVWTLYPKLSFGRSGGRNKTSAAIIDKNVLGSGKEISVDYKTEAQRNTLSMNFLDKHILGSRWQLKTQYSVNND
ncbi:MAG: hypothetical protein HQL46_16855, partial [Gammaproteobacteria bacterium]|nr:hypothetical protein [Gammaproteobacteria bacterium]